MYKQETIKPYEGNDEKGKLVEQMFDNIAPTYDTLNHRLSWDIDKHWRKKAIAALKRHAPKTILDIATGTGDFALLMAEEMAEAKVTGVDLSEGMMDIARKKTQQRGLQERIVFQKEDCLQLSFPDNTYDAVTAAFGIRNFQDLDKGLREMCRVLKPGGQLSIVELTLPHRFPMKQLFQIYAHTVLPIYGRLISKDKAAYQYLTRTIEAFPQGEEMMGILQRAGFGQCTFQRLTFGICTMYFATK